MTTTSCNRNRRVVIVRHGERVDHRFQDKWVENCFDSDENYTRMNLNQPDKVPKRAGYPKTFIRDTPLTAVGCFQAKLRGEGLRQEGILSDNFEVFVSPSLRCVKTASNILKGMKAHKVMKIEPCLFEWTQIPWYLNGNMPNWMTPEEMHSSGFNIDLSYVPYLPASQLKEGESVENYYERSHKLILHLLKENGNKDLLLVGHGFSFEGLSRQLLGDCQWSAEELLAVVRNVPYCGMITLEEDFATKKWNLLPLQSQLQLSHASSHDFDARQSLLAQ